MYIILSILFVFWFLSKKRNNDGISIYFPLFPTTIKQYREKIILKNGLKEFPVCSYLILSFINERYENGIQSKKVILIKSFPISLMNWLYFYIFMSIYIILPISISKYLYEKNITYEIGDTTSELLFGSYVVHIKCVKHEAHDIVMPEILFAGRTSEYNKDIQILYFYKLKLLMNILNING